MADCAANDSHVADENRPKPHPGDQEISTSSPTFLGDQHSRREMHADEESGKQDAAVAKELPAENPSQAKGPRLHHLDWFRSLMIAVAVYLHVWQVQTNNWNWPGKRFDNVHMQDFHLGEEKYWASGHSVNGYSWRWISIGRQFCITLLFFISGSAFAFGSGSVLPFFKKVGLMTLVGFGVNACIWFGGPQKDWCSYWRSLKDESCSGPLINWTIAPDVGPVFPIVFQMWYTVFLMAFIFQDFVLYNCIRQFNSCSYTAKPYPDNSVSLIQQGGIRWFCIIIMYFGLSQWGPWSSIIELVFFLILEAAFDVCLVLSARTPSSRPSWVRFWQYAAAACTVLQFSFPNFKVDDSGMVGTTIIYFHFFKQAAALGFTITVTRQKVGRVISRVWPAVILWLILVGPSTNFWQSGQPAYPWFPHVVDRLLYMAGSLTVCLSIDSVGRAFAQLDFCEALPEWLSIGTGLAYLFHPIGIVILIRVQILQSAPGITTLCILIITSLIGALIVHRRKIWAWRVSATAASRSKA